MEVWAILDDLARGSATDDVGEQDAALTNASGGVLRNSDVPRGGQLPDESCDLGHERLQYSWLDGAGFREERHPTYFPMQHSRAQEVKVFWKSVAALTAGTAML